MKEKCPKSHWVLPGEQSHYYENLSIQEVQDLHIKAYEAGYTVDITPVSGGKGIEVVLNEIVIDAVSQERI